MANNENLIPIPGRLHSVATEGHVAGADEIYDDTLQKDQATINSEVQTAIGTGGTVDQKIVAAVNALDATKSQTAGADGLALSVTEVDGKITSISGSIAANTYDANGAAAAAKSEVLGSGVGTNYNTLKKIEDKLSPIETAVGTGGSIDQRIEDATEDCAYLGENDGSAVIADFDPQTDTVWKKAQTLSNADKSQVKTNLGLPQEIYSKTEVNELVSTPHQNYVTVATYSELPASGSTDTIYRVSNYDGTQVAAGVYSEYAWSGSAYVFLAAKSSVDEVFDISEYHAGAKYADLAAALDSNNGGGVPQSLQKGGMSVKFVSNSDNNYVQYRLMSDTFNTTETNWQGVDEEPINGSENLVKSGGVANIITNNNIQLFNNQDILHKAGIEIQKTNVLELTGTLDSAYLNENGKIVSTTNIVFKVNYYRVNQGDIVLLNGIIGNDWSSTSAIFTKTLPSVNITGEYIIRNRDANGQLNLLYQAPFDGYIACNQRNNNQKILIYEYEIINLAKLDNDDSINALMSVLDCSKNNVKVEPTGSVSGYYLGVYGNISTSNNGILKYYAVEKGQKYHINGDLSDGWPYGSVVFTKDIPSAGVQTTLISANYSVNMDYIATDDGYLVLQKVVSTNKEINLYNYHYSSQLNLLDDVLNISIQKGYELDRYNIISRSYFNASGRISSVSNDNMYCIVYKVTANQKIKIEGDMGSGFEFPAVCFFLNEPSIGSLADTILSRGEQTVNIKYTPNQSGYLVTWHRNNSNYSTAYALIPKSTPVDASFPLRYRTIAVLGDSIIQNMGSMPSEVVVTLKNFYDPTDTTIYQQSDATVVNGIIYLTSSLDNGQVTENSIRLEVVNDVQTAIDSRTWTKLKDATGAIDVINCGFGAARIVERGICTYYPSADILSEGEGDNPWDGLMASLPNEVKMLKRIVDSGLRRTPDAVVIWLGVNGASTIITDTYDDAMAIPWATLSDDVNGYTYRTKFYGAMRYAIEYIYRVFPYTNIFIVSPVQTNRGDQKINSDDPAYRGYTQLNELTTCLKKMSDRYGCQFVDALHEIGIANFSYKADSMSGNNEISTGTALGNLCPTFLSDGLHPNDNGKVVWTKFLAKRLNTLYFDKKEI